MRRCGSPSSRPSTHEVKATAAIWFEDERCKSCNAHLRRIQKRELPLHIPNACSAITISEILEWISSSIVFQHGALVIDILNQVGKRTHLRRAVSPMRGTGS